MPDKVENNQLQVILKEQGVTKDEAVKLVEAFGGPFEEVGEILQDYQTIVVKDEADTKTMKVAREKRLALKKARSTVENNRKAMKESINKQGKAIDSVARFVKEVIAPAEEHLQLQEDYAKIKAAERKATLLAERITTISGLTDNVGIYNLEEMDAATYSALVDKLMKERDDQIAAEKKAEEDRIAAEKAKAEEDKRVREENARLKAEAEERDAKEKKEREEREAAERAEREKVEAAERKAEQDRQAEYRRLSDIKVSLLEFAHNIKTTADADNASKGLVETFSKLPEDDQKNDMIDAAFNKSKAEIAELRAYIVDQATKKAEAEKAAAEAKAKAAQEEEERQALLAPDRQKLETFAQALATIREQKLPAVKTAAAQKIVNQIEESLQTLQIDIQKKAKEL